LIISFGYLKHMQRKLKFAWQRIGTQSSFWIKNDIDPIVRWRGLDKINVHTLCNLHFSNDHRPHVCGSWNITEQKKTEK